MAGLMAAGAGLKLAWALAFTPAAIPAELALHEGSHAVVATAVGLHVKDFAPWPQQVGGRWVLGEVSAAGPVSRSQDLLVSLAPFVADLVVIGIMLAVKALDPAPWLWGLCTALQAMAAVDFMHGALLVNAPGSDAYALHRDLR